MNASSCPETFVEPLRQRPMGRRTAAVCLALLMPLAGAVHAAGGPPEQVTVRATAHFDFGRAALRAGERPALLAEVGKLADVTWQTVEAVGHTDDIGPVAANQRLSVERARAVKAWLVAQGLDASMIRADGRGELAPAAANDTAANRALNRRTEVVFRGVRPSN